jgi:aryl sulfotransferase
MLLHYANLISDLPGQMRRIAAFLDTPIDEVKFPAMVDRCGVDYMCEHAASMGMMGEYFHDGAASFFNKGVNGRWRDVLSKDEIDRCDEVAAKRLTPDCAHWLRTGDLPA